MRVRCMAVAYSHVGTPHGAHAGVDGCVATRWHDAAQSYRVVEFSS